MRKVSVVCLVLSIALIHPAIAKKLSWQAGWDNFGEPLDFSTSYVRWSLKTGNDLNVEFVLNSATPSKAYSVAIGLFNTCQNGSGLTEIGTFPIPGPGGWGVCGMQTRQGVSATAEGAVVGALVTDMNGNGSVTVNVGQIPSGTYDVEFLVLNGAACDLVGGGDCSSPEGEADFQSPGPFGTTTEIVAP